MVQGLQNFAQFICNNWLVIIIVVALIIVIAKAVYEFSKKSTEEKIAIVKQQVSQIVLKLVTEAELQYENWVKAGAVKRAQVIDAIFTQYPILSVITDQDSVIAWLDELIDNALETLNGILAKNIPDTTEDEDEEDVTYTLVHEDEEA